jgi:serine protease Do
MDTHLELIEKNMTNFTPMLRSSLLAATFLSAAFLGYFTPPLLGHGGAAYAASPDFSKVFANIAKDKTQAVVNISSKQKPRLPEGGVKLKEFYGKMFPFPMEETPRESLGSGFIVEADGYILTNSHVVSGADEIMVSFGNGNAGEKKREYKAKLVTSDPKLDVALIKIEPETPLKTLEMGDSEALEAGDWVMAIGNPFGFSQSVTVGVVSAKGRIIGATQYDDFIQTDAAINPGNSGGPLLDYNGKVVGINTAIFTGGMSAGNIGVGFAIPINAIKAVYAELKKGQIKRGWLGVRLLPVSKEMAQKLGLEGESGAMVETVKKGSPADKAGFKPLDVIVEFEGKSVPSQMALPKMVAAVHPGSAVKVGLIRDGKKMTLKVTLGEFKDEEAQSMGAPGDEKTPAKTRLGMKVEELTPQWIKRLELDPAVKGLVVTDIDQGTPAAEAGLAPGDVIVSIERKEVKSLAEYEKALNSVKPGSTILILVVRGGDNAVVMLKTPEK